MLANIPYKPSFGRIYIQLLLQHTYGTFKHKETLVNWFKKDIAKILPV